MKPVERVWYKLYTTGKAVFLIFSIMSIPILLLAVFVLKAELNSWAYVLVFILMMNGIGWLLLGLFGLAYDRILAYRLSHLKSKGLMHEITIKRMLPNWTVRLGGYITASIEGSYMDNSKNIKTVRSTNHIFTTFDTKDDFVANVYVDSSNSESYFVELLRKD